LQVGGRQQRTVYLYVQYLHAVIAHSNVHLIQSPSKLLVEQILVADEVVGLHGVDGLHEYGVNCVVHHLVGTGFGLLGRAEKRGVRNAPLGIHRHIVLLLVVGIHRLTLRNVSVEPAVVLLHRIYKGQAEAQAFTVVDGDVFGEVVQQFGVVLCESDVRIQYHFINGAEAVYSRLFAFTHGKAGQVEQNDCQQQDAHGDDDVTDGLESVAQMLVLRHIDC
jgi:hypothetical protein